MNLMVTFSSLSQQDDFIKDIILSCFNRMSLMRTWFTSSKQRSAMMNSFQHVENTATPSSLFSSGYVHNSHSHSCYLHSQLLFLLFWHDLNSPHSFMLSVIFCGILNFLSSSLFFVCFLFFALFLFLLSSLTVFVFLPFISFLFLLLLCI